MDYRDSGLHVPRHVFHQNGFNITINTVNMIFLLTGLLLHKTPMAYMRAVSAAARSTAGILVQFRSMPVSSS